MSAVAQPLLDTIEADEPSGPINSNNTQTSRTKNAASQVVLNPTNRSNGGSQMATTQGDAESGIGGIFRQVCFYPHYRKRQATLIPIIMDVFH
ncbi:hypothetical protein BJ165DRAFT_1432794 [Panaeolus papilionaceus]|nr:hypothetical protein BJ165DRAFT_1432794 [Panaeolus papilionaceus]